MQYLQVFKFRSLFKHFAESVSYPTMPCFHTYSITCLIQLDYKPFRWYVFQFKRLLISSRVCSHFNKIIKYTVPLISELFLTVQKHVLKRTSCHCTIKEVGQFSNSFQGICSTNQTSVIVMIRLIKAFPIFFFLAVFLIYQRRHIQVHCHFY